MFIFCRTIWAQSPCMHTPRRWWLQTAVLRRWKSHSSRCGSCSGWRVSGGGRLLQCAAVCGQALAALITCHSSSACYPKQLYAYNGPYRVGGAPFLTTGAHDGDIEHLTVRCHPTTGALVGVWFNAHRSRDGCWVAGPQVGAYAGRLCRQAQTVHLSVHLSLHAASMQATACWLYVFILSAFSLFISITLPLPLLLQVPRAADGSIAAYTALHGHGVYPLAGRIPRHFFLGTRVGGCRSSCCLLPLRLVQAQLDWHPD